MSMRILIPVGVAAVPASVLALASRRTHAAVTGGHRSAQRRLKELVMKGWNE